MRHQRVLTVAVLTAAISVGATTLAGPAGAATGSIWTVQSTPNPHAAQLTNSVFESVSASGPDEAWAVGSFSNQSARERPLAEHWNGSMWTVTDVPRPVDQQAVLSGVDDLAPDNAWAVGDSFGGGSGGNQNGRTLIEHWDGTDWSVVPSPDPAVGVPGDSDVLTSISGTGPDDLWVAGSDNNESTMTLSLLFEHWNGTTWTAMTSPTPEFAIQTATAITAISPDDVWAVGSQFTDGTRTLAAHWNGTIWSIVPTPNLSSAGTPQNQLTGVSASGPDDVWASGFANNVDKHNLDVPYIVHWNGTMWQLTKVPTTGSDGSRINGIVALSATDVWSVGQTQESNGALLTITEEFNGSAWRISASPDPGSVGMLTVNTLQAVGGAGGRDLFAVGTQEIPGQLVNRTLAIATKKG
jgi:hypothetical protein